MLGLAVAAAPARAQSTVGPSPTEPALADKQGKEFHAFRLTGAAPRVDGRLDDEVWRRAENIGDFVQMDPDNMAPATERTTAQIAYDDRYIYVAVHCYYRDPSQVSAGLGRRDNFPRSDRILIDFDPRHDHQTGYVFQVNASGVQGDNTVYDDTRSSFDYDGVWEAGAQVVADGWSAEMRIPFSQMRFNVPPGGDAVWGFNMERQIAKTGENVRWIANPRGTQGFVSRFGHLIFGERLTPPRRVELLPFTLGSVQRSAVTRNQATINGGLDMRVGLGSSTSLSATISPDFGQVEADPAVLNLSVFETFFPEKRPFFLEDSRVFVLPYGQAPDFYSRRIGQAPGRLALKDGDTLVRKPDQTTILGAAKLTGKTGAWTYGGLAAMTSREYADVDAATTDGDGNTISVVRTRRLIEPATLYSVGRVQRDMFHATSNIGFIGTAVVREKDLNAFTGGPDFNLRWGKNRYSLNGHWLATHAPIVGVMRSDVGGVTNVNYNGKYLATYAHFDHFGRNFRNADAGFLSSRTNKNEFNWDTSFARPDPGKIFRNMSADIGLGRSWTGDGLVFGKYFSGSAYLQFLNYWSINMGGTHSPRRLDDLDTRGGPPIVKPQSDSFFFNVQSDFRKRWGGNINFNGSRDAAGAWQGSVGPNARWQPSNRLQTNVSVNYTFAQDVAQWVTNEDLDGDGTDENIYGRLRRDVVNITGRATYAFSPDMTLEAYLQPFVAVGDYTDIRKLTRANSFDFDPVTISSDPDFNRKSLRGTIVMRWEYLRGSTLFVVWNMSNSDSTRVGVFSPWRDLGSGFTTPGANVFVVKLSYWFTP